MFNQGFPFFPILLIVKVVGTESPSVIGVVAAYRRPQMLVNLLGSLAGATTLRKVIVVDNGSDEETERAAKQAPVPVLYHRPEGNLGCGGGVARGLKLGLQEEGVTHFCMLDDDAESRPGALDILIREMILAEADVAVPLVLTREGFIGWPPGLQEAHPWEVIRRPRITPAEYYKRCGTGPVPFTWAPWPMMAVSARAVRECGCPRDDFWLCAEDLEYSLRITRRHTGVLVPAATCRHLPPASSGGDALGGAHYLRFCLMLQNLSYLCTRLAHGRRSIRHLPGNYLRFMRTFGVNGTSLRDAGLALWHGAVRGKPGGVAGALKERMRDEG